MAETNIFDTSTPPTVLCCLCGAPVPANPSNMCINCIRTQVDITDGITKQLNLQFCRGCGRYFQPPNAWIAAELESRQLLAICLKRVRGLNKVRLIDASFVWTEPHSKRVKVKLTVQKEVFGGAILQQAFVVEYVVVNQQCSGCARTEAKLTWRAVVQLRQKVDHKRTFYWLEQLILKHDAHRQANSIKEMPDGLDFFFDQRNHAIKFVEFVNIVTPIRVKEAKELVSHDIKSNIYNYKFTYSVEIAPVCKDDLVCIPLKMAQSSGNISPLLICTKMTSSLHFVDPLTLQTADISSSVFYNLPFRSLATRDRLITYIVIDTNLLGPRHGKYALAEVVLAREVDLGRNDMQFVTHTHLGNLLKAGDTCMGYDLSTMNFNDADISSLRGKDLPDVFIVKKTYPLYRAKHKRRKWKLRGLEMEQDGRMDIDKMEKEKEEFLQDLEEDPEMRQNVNLYRDDDVLSTTTASEYDPEEFPGPRMDELVRDMGNLQIEDMDTGDD